MPADPVENNDPFGLSRLNDPEFEAKERARLMGVDEGDTPSAEIQEVFINWIDDLRRMNQWSGGFNVQPDKLFFGHVTHYEHGTIINREYYKHPSAPEFSGSDLLAALTLEETFPGNFSGNLTRYGESPNFQGKTSEQVSIHFIRRLSRKEGLNFSQVSVGAEFEGRELNLYFDEAGDISTISFHPRKSGNAGLQASDPPSRFDFKMSELLETGIGSFQKGTTTYEAVYDKDNGRVVLTRKENEEIKDVITVPRHLDGVGTFRNLFSEQFLSNIFGASTEMDKTWKDFNLDTVGVKWDRPTPNPTS